MSTRVESRGNFGKCYFFDGVDDYMTRGDSGILQRTGTMQLTLEAWIYLFKTGVEQFIIAKEDYGLVTPEGNYALFIDSTDKLNFRFYLNGVEQKQTDTVSKFTTGIWYHVAVVVTLADASDNVKFYVNGINTYKATEGDDFPATASTKALHIGCSLNNSIRAGFFNGMIDEVRILSGYITYSPAVTTERYLGTETNTSVFYPFEVLSGSDAKDYSGNNLHATISGATLVNRGFYKNTITVAKEGGDFSKIQDAIDYINNNESPSSTNIWTVLIYPGEYVESAVYQKSYINIIGIDRSSCIINGNIVFQNISNVLVENLTIKNASNNAIQLAPTTSSMSDIVLRHLDITGTDGISLGNTYSLSCIIESCVIKATTNRGVYIHNNSITCKIKNSYIESVQYGIRVDSGATITELECQGCKIIGSGTYEAIDVNNQTAKFYNCRIEKGASATYSITGVSGGNVIIGGCSLEGGINSSNITVTYKSDLNVDNSSLIYSGNMISVKDSGITFDKLSSGAVHKDNIVSNASFENWSTGISNRVPDGWSKIGAPTDVSRDTGEKDNYGGQYAVKITSAGANNEGISITLDKLRPSTTYFVSVRTKATSGDTAKIWTTGGAGGADVLQTTTSTSWVTLSGVFTTDSTPTNIALKLGSSNTTDIVWFDELLVLDKSTDFGFKLAPVIPYDSDKYNRRSIKWAGQSAVKIEATSDAPAKFIASGLYGGKDIEYVLAGSSGNVMENGTDKVLDFGTALYHLESDGTDEYGFNTLSPSLSAPSYVAGKFNNCVRFNKVNSQYLNKTSGIINMPTGDNPFTVEFWVKTTETTNEHLFQIGNGTATTRLCLVIVISPVAADGKVGVNDGLGNIFQSNSSISNGNWHHVAISSDGTTTKLFIDGSLDASSSITWNINPNVIYLGATNWGFYFSGDIDELRISQWCRYTDSFTAPTSAFGKEIGLDTGSEVADNWYGIFVVDDGAGGFNLKAVTFVRFRSQASQVITCRVHTGTSADKGYSWTTDAYNGSKILVLTGKDKGKVRNVTANNNSATASTITYGGTALSDLADGDWIMISPAGATNFRYLGSIFNDSSSDIPQFTSEEKYFQWTIKITALSGGSATTWTAVDLTKCISPIANGVVMLSHLSTGTMDVNLSNVNTTGAIGVGGWTFEIWTSSNHLVPFPKLLVLTPQTVYYYLGAGGGTVAFLIAAYSE